MVPLCGKLLDIEEANFDHIVPVARGRKHKPWNIQLTHVACNTTKGSKLAYPETDSGGVTRLARESCSQISEFTILRIYVRSGPWAWRCLSMAMRSAKESGGLLALAAR